MSSQDDEPEFRVLAFVLMTAVVLALGLAVGIGIQKSRGTGSTMAAAAPAPATAVAAPVGDDASVVVENGVVKFYFASGKADLAPGALDALADAIRSAKSGKRLTLSGFHDATGDPAFNAELAKQRAMVVRDALVGAGVAESAMELRKPEQTTGSGNNAEARRVEVVIAP
ncbi:MAG: OmpA family protein [Hydrogenophaga sp.]|uniref:OmpA family protein n=1 Tax=Hydrogenophaga sp. TaxID=1904254 RepID=UPI003D0E5C17